MPDPSSNPKDESPRGSNSSSSSNNNNNVQQKTFLLNVGGTTFMTSRSSMLRVKGSFFEAMVSGRHDYPSETVIMSETETGSTNDDNKSYFIDRDGTHFRHILNFLRTGAVVSLPEDETSREELAIEADFYGLEQMVKAIRQPPLDITEFLPPEVVSIQEEEKELRTEFRTLDYWMKPLLPYKHLVCLLGDGRDEAYSVPLMTAIDPPLRQDESCLFLAEIWGEEGEWPEEKVPVTVATLEEFKTNFNREFPNVLPRLDEVLCSEPIIVAGGAVLRPLTASEGIRTSKFWTGASWSDSQRSDVDLFIYGASTGDANRIVRRVFQALAVNEEPWGIVRAKGVVNIHNIMSKVQIVLRIYSSPTEVLIGFDVDCCCCCYDGKNVWATRRYINALTSGVNVLNPLHSWPNKASYEVRLGKYAFRGFAIAIPGVDHSRIDYRSISGRNLRDLKGLARLVKVVIEIGGSKTERFLFDFRGRYEESQRPCFPTEIKTLRDEILSNATQDEILVRFKTSGYDDLPDELLVPEVYGFGDDPSQYFWYDVELPVDQHTRTSALETIIHCKYQNPPEGIPRKMKDAWSTDKRSREYLNDDLEQN
ncbi:BTB/POZ domain containing protein [Nitzschia inconspicua]|uniref:BTB/POZ domain containing protein n=1 Tax=Nitzschia inconspicua TaxID=303405 RepID=A0A9K3KVJ2_9STRA|nr:BTB/POZ domain containing protein [Nitzschia inconspicua]